MSVKFRPRRHVIDLLFTLALFCVFAASSLLVVLIGADVYKSAAHNMDANFNLQTSLNYVAAKVRQNDSDGSVYAGQWDGGPALILEQDFSGSVYHTYIYEQNGKLCELFTAVDSGATRDSGSAIMDISSFSVEPVGKDLLRIRCASGDAAPAELIVGTRCAFKEEAAI